MFDEFSRSLFVFIGLCFAAAMTGAFFKPGKWYETLEKPPWCPPNWLFPVAWTLLYAMIAVSGWLVWQQVSGDLSRALLPMGLWLTQLLFNAGWSPVFFGMKRMDIGMAVLSGLWLSILATIVVFWPISTLAGALLLPYLLWVTIAGALNLSVWRRNPEANGVEV